MLSKYYVEVHHKNMNYGERYRICITEENSDGFTNHFYGLHDLLGVEAKDYREKVKLYKGKYLDRAKYEFINEKRQSYLSEFIKLKNARAFVDEYVASILVMKKLTMQKVVWVIEDKEF